MSLISKSGCSNAAKCPPFGIFVNCLTLNIRSKYDLGGQGDISAGKIAIAVGTLICLNSFGKNLPPSSLLP